MKQIKVILAGLSILLLPFSVFSTNHFTESFSGGPTDYYTGSHTFSSGLTWDLAVIKGESAANSYGGFGGAARFMISTTAYIISPSVNTLESITFKYRELNAIGGGTFKVQKSVNGGAFVDIATQTFSGTTYQTFTLAVNDNSNNIRIKVVGINNSTYLIVDELTLSAVSTDPILNLSASSLSGFSYILGSGPSTSQSYNLSGSNLTGAPGNITITAPTNYEISLNNSTFSTSIPVPYTSATLASTPIYVRLIAGLAVNTYNAETISNAGGGAPTVNVTCNGEVLSPPPPSIIANPTTLSGFTYILGSGPSTSQSYNLSGSNLTGAPGNITITAPTNYEISLNNSTFSTSIPVPYTSATLTSTPIYVRLIAGLAVNTYNTATISNAGGGAPTVNVTCNGEVLSPPPPSITANPTTLSGFTYILGSGPSTSQSFNISGNNLTGFPANITLTAPADYQVSIDNTTFANYVDVLYTSSTLSPTPIYVRLIAGLPVNSYNSEEITISGSTAASISVACSGSVTAVPSPEIITNVSNLSGFTYVVGSGPSASQSYSLSGSNLSGAPGNITVTAPANYEISLNNSSFSTSISVPYTSSTLTSTPIYVRLIAGLAVNTYNAATISNAGGGATTINVTCNGSVTAVPPATLVANPTSLSGFTYIFGSGPSTSQSYSLSGSNLTGAPGNITVTAPANYEISLNNSSFSTSIPIPYSSATLTSTPIYVRLIAGLAVNTYNAATISNAGGGATTINVTCNGQVNEVSLSCATDLIISEYHEPSGGNNKGVEIYNGTGEDVDLSSYYIGVIVNGGTDIENSIVLSGILGDKQTVCVYNDADADPNFRLKGDINITWTNATWNGDDAIYLLKGGSTLNFIIDVIGDMPPVTDPGNEFINNGVSTLNTGLIRKSVVFSPTTTWSGLEWDVVAAGTYTDWGTHTMDCPTDIQNPANITSETIELYPNPNNGVFKLLMPDGIGIYTITITDILGNIVYESDRMDSEIHLNQDTGIYILNLNNEQKKFVKKFVVY